VLCSEDALLTAQLQVPAPAPGSAAPTAGVKAESAAGAASPLSDANEGSVSGDATPVAPSKTTKLAAVGMAALVAVSGARRHGGGAGGEPPAPPLVMSTVTSSLAFTDAGVAGGGDGATASVLLLAGTRGGSVCAWLGQQSNGSVPDAVGPAPTPLDAEPAATSEAGAAE
jgi:hypothetical protein